MNPSVAVDPRRAIFASQALLAGGWAKDVLLSWDDAGKLIQVMVDVASPADVARAEGPLMPGMPNLHSHAFQRAFAGLAEYRGRADDSFWSWRDLMYRFALAVSPQQLEDIATWLYIEMLQGGYTSVCEFHYLHHDQLGRPYADLAETSLRLAAAAERAGIGLTLLPVLYQDSGFGSQPSRPDQRRFVNSVDGLLRIVGMLKDRGVSVGVAPHSLRAVGPDALHELVAGAASIDPDMPIHIHIAEQQQEVLDCLAWCGQRPVQWLLDQMAIDRRWCLVHATHLDERELGALAASGATVGLCPTTEANLGDGIFPAAVFDVAGGRWGVGSDSHASVSTSEELRLLEYTQRLTLSRRNVLASAAQPQVADRMWLAAVDGGARARGLAGGGLAVGQSADFVVLADDGLGAAQSLAGFVFANHGHRSIAEVWVAGCRRIEHGHHAFEDAARERFVAARRTLLNEV